MAEEKAAREEASRPQMTSQELNEYWSQKRADRMVEKKMRTRQEEFEESIREAAALKRYYDQHRNRE